ncbi:hypothetical protein [Rhizobium leguminosarum]|uniref:hypothetical protein n=1 Tax=Rhizobium leguminosarum TaxID=384 RepID=UPI001D8B5FC4|nr:hypothetical protein [Rhizobium leguminosarum]MBP2449455.1 cytochrome c-type biogenesis protein CcmH/NrfG [Rhizobium leguminosarum]
MAEAQESVTADTLDVLREILSSSPKTGALSYIALRSGEVGRSAEARTSHGALGKSSPAGAPWLPLANQHISASGGVQMTALKQEGHST